MRSDVANYHVIQKTLQVLSYSRISSRRQRPQYCCQSLRSKYPCTSYLVTGEATNIMTRYEHSDHRKRHHRTKVQGLGYVSEHLSVSCFTLHVAG